MGVERVGRVGVGVGGGGMGGGGVADCQVSCTRQSPSTDC